MPALPYFPMYARDWLSGQGTSMMLPEQEGAFIRLLCTAWGDGSELPSLPDDDRALAVMSRLGQRWKKYGGLVRDQFDVADNGRLYNAKLSAIWTEQVERSKKLASNGQKGGRAKAGLEQDPSKDLAPVYHSEASADSDAVLIDDERAEPSASVRLAVYANKAVAEKWGERPSPFTAGSAIRFAELLTTRGIPIDFAGKAIFAQCRNSDMERPPNSINYFQNGVIDRWDKEIARRQTASSDIRAPSKPEHIEAEDAATRIRNGHIVEQRKQKPDGDAWWKRMVRECGSTNLGQIIAYAAARDQEAA